MKYVHLIVSLLFILFAVVQWNDPDPWLWIAMYLIVGVVAFLAFRAQYYFKFNLLYTLILLLGCLYFLPGVIEWFKDGMPSITDSMQASSPYIELVREFFGLLISLFAMSYYLKLSKKKQS